MPFEAVVRSCIACGVEFETTVGEQAFLRDLHGPDFQLPRRCLVCRAKRRHERYTEPVSHQSEDEHLTCIDCGEEFIFGGRDRAYFARQGFSKPKRCRICRTARRQSMEDRPVAQLSVAVRVGLQR